jgi:hypothetical protein
MMQKRTIYSLLLTSFILVFAISVSFAQTVTIEGKNVLRCDDGTLNITIDPGVDISAFEIVFDVESTVGGGYFDAMTVDWAAGFTVLTNRYIDLSQVDNVTPDKVRIAGMMTESGDTYLAAGATVVAQVSFTTNDVCNGEITLSGGTWEFTPCLNLDIVAQSQFVDYATNALIPASVTSGIVAIVNQPPVITATIPDETIEWGEVYTAQIEAEDGDLPQLCENLVYAKVSGPAALQVNATTGAIVWLTTFDDVCTHDVTVSVTDVCGVADSTSFTICVHNNAPTIVCPTEINRILWGHTAEGTVVGDDVDGVPPALEYSVVSWNGPGAIVLDPATGDWSWATMEDNAYIGIFELCIAVTDGANLCDPCSPENADTCCLEIEVTPTVRVTIEKVHNAFVDQHTLVSIDLDDMIDPGHQMGGYDFLISYDNSAMTLTHAAPGAMLLPGDCGWEYFTYRHGAEGNCGANACPSGMVRLVAIADVNNGANHPDCYGPPDAVSGQLAVLNFFVTDNWNLSCQYIPVRWKWYDCGDNTISNKGGDSLFISRYIFDFEDGLDPLLSIDDPTVEFPSLFGANYLCDTALGDGKPDPYRIIDFWNGGVDIVCNESIDARGDINLNEIPNEIADVVLFSNYFVYGLAAFDGLNVQGVIAATDVNADGRTLSVADLVYLIRIVQGDASPYHKISAPVDVQYAHRSNGVLDIAGNVQMGAVHVVVEGDMTPELLAENVELKYNFDGTNTNCLVWSLKGEAFTGQFLNVDGNIVSIEMSTVEGSPVNAKLIPNEFALNQNYPNPFNPTTTISFNVKKQAEYILTIYNVNGQEVTSFNGIADAGEKEIVWNASSVASGVYFYKLQIDNYTETKKMVLLK